MSRRVVDERPCGAPWWRRFGFLLRLGLRLRGGWVLLGCGVGRRRGLGGGCILAREMRGLGGPRRILHLGVRHRRTEQQKGDDISWSYMFSLCHT